MLNMLIAGMAGAAGGALVVVGLVAWRLLKRVRGGSAGPAVIDTELDDQIQRAAAWWANAHDRPMAAPLIARKLRLIYGLQQRRRKRRGWSR
jgi:hypothetical protein